MGAGDTGFPMELAGEGWGWLKWSPALRGQQSLGTAQDTGLGLQVAPPHLQISWHPQPSGPSCTGVSLWPVLPSLPSPQSVPGVGQWEGPTSPGHLSRERFPEVFSYIVGAAVGVQHPSPGHRKPQGPFRTERVQACSLQNSSPPPQCRIAAWGGGWL